MGTVAQPCFGVQTWGAGWDAVAFTFLLGIFLCASWTGSALEPVCPAAGWQGVKLVLPCRSLFSSCW